MSLVMVIINKQQQNYDVNFLEVNHWVELEVYDEICIPGNTTRQSRLLLIRTLFMSHSFN